MEKKTIETNKELDFSIIYTNKKEEIIVDHATYQDLNLFTWHLDKDGYARRLYRIVGGYSSEFMHRRIMNAPKGISVDHINRVRNDNRMKNLRLCTIAENNRNLSVKTDNRSSSIYKGVRKRKERYEVSICVDSKRIYLGVFTDEVASANCYNYFAKEYFKEFANVNDVTFMERDIWETFKIIPNPKSKHLGVTMEGKTKGWISRITNKYTGKREYLGYYRDEVDAAIAYNIRGLEIYGDEFTTNNIIVRGECE
jgi:hypothetical protein